MLHSEDKQAARTQLAQPAGFIAIQEQNVLAQQKSSFTVNMLGAAEFSFLGREDDQALADLYDHLRKELGLPSY